MVHVHRSFTVEKDQPTVLSFLSDFANAEQWDPGTQTCTRADSGPIRVGARWRNVSSFLGRTATLDYSLERMDADYLVFQGRNDSAHSVDDLRVTDTGDGRTRIVYDATISLTGRARLVDPLLALPMKRIADTTVEQMKDVLDAL